MSASAWDWPDGCSREEWISTELGSGALEHRLVSRYLHRPPIVHSPSLNYPTVTRSSQLVVRTQGAARSFLAWLLGFGWHSLYMLTHQLDVEDSQMLRPRPPQGFRGRTEILGDSALCQT